MTQGIDKFEQIRKLVRDDAEQQSERILSDANAEAERRIGEKKKALFDAYGEDVSRVTQRFRADEKRRVSEKRAEEERRVLLHRAALTDRFFEEIARSLRETAASESYADYLKRAAKKANEALPLGPSSSVFCREEDVSAVKAAFSPYGASVGTTEEIRLGGFFVRNGNLFLDLSLDAALEREREAFSRVKELQI